MAILTLDDASESSPLESYENPNSFTSNFSAAENLSTRAARYISNQINPGVAVSKEDAIEQAKAQNVDITKKLPENGTIGENQLKSMIQGELDDRRRADLQNTARSKTGAFFGSLAGGMVDPLNVAAAFIPVVGEARLTTMLEGMVGEAGVSAARAASGAISQAIEGEGVNLAAEGAASAAGREAYFNALKSGAGIAKTAGADFLTRGLPNAAIGNTALEAANIFLNKQEGKDSNAVQSMENIAFGTLLGGGIHAGAGAFAEWIRQGIAPEEGPPLTDPKVGGGNIPERLSKLPPEGRVDALRTATAQLAQDQTVNVDPVVEGHLAQAEGRTDPQTAENFKDQIGQIAAEKPGSAFENPEALARQQEALRNIPAGSPLDVATKAADEAEAQFREKAPQFGIDPDKALSKSNDAVERASTYEKALKILGNCAARGES